MARRRFRVPACGSGIGSWRAITFVTRDQGDQLTKVESRVNQLLPQYETPGFEAARPRQRKQFVIEEAPPQSRSAVYSYA